MKIKYILFIYTIDVKGRGRWNDAGIYTSKEDYIATIKRLEINNIPYYRANLRSKREGRLYR